MRHWSSRGAIAWLLWPASLVFRVVVVTRRFFYKIKIFGSKHPGIPVIVVGNLTAGGSGKTPLVLWIAALLKEHRWKPGIVSRGYGGSTAQPVAVTIASDPAEVGDEKPGGFKRQPRLRRSRGGQRDGELRLEHLAPLRDTKP